MTAYNPRCRLAYRGDCALYPSRYTKHVKNGRERHSYWGVCTKPGFEQEQRFVGTYMACEKKFFAWADSIPKTMEIELPKPAAPEPLPFYEPEQEEETKGSVMQQEEEQKDAIGKDIISRPKEMPEKVYALAYKRGNTVRYVMAFADDDAALDAAEVAGKALEVAGVDGEYTVDELAMRW